MEFNTTTTVGVFALVIALGVGGLIGAPIPMAVETTLMMVLPSMVIFGAIMLAIGVKHGEYRATR